MQSANRPIGHHQKPVVSHGTWIGTRTLRVPDVSSLRLRLLTGGQRSESFIDTSTPADQGLISPFCSRWPGG